jgi:hypothetical protein
MELKIKINTTEDLIQFIKFFSKTNLDFIPMKEDFSTLLYEAICSGNILLSWLNNSTFQNYVNELITLHPEDNKLKLYLKGYTQDSDANEMLEPTEHFKIFCGYEGMNKDGLLSKKMALDFIMYQINKRNIKVSDGTIHMNEYLNTLFNTSLNMIRNDELLGLIDTLFI